MSDVTVSVVENTTSVVVSNDVVEINVVESPVTISTGTSGPQGASGVGYTGVTSTSSVPVAVGLHTWTVANVGAFLPGMRIRAIHTDTPSIWLEGFANVASGTTIIITADKLSGSGTHNTWKFASAGEVGQTGAAGATGATGATGPTGVVTATAPITYDSGTQTVGINQAGLTLAQSQITNLVSDLAGKANLAGGNALTGAQTFTSDSATTRPLLVKGASGQTTNLIDIQNSSASLLTNFNASGKLGIGTGTNASLGDLDVWAGTPSLNIVSTTFKSTGPKSAGILNWRSGGSTGERFAPVAAIEGFDEYAGFGYEGSLRFSTLLGATLTEKARITNIGSFLVNATTPVLATGNTLNTQLGVISANATTVGAVVRGASGQTANLLEIQSNASATLVQVTSGGSIQSSANVTAGTLTALGRLTVNTGTTTTIGAVIRGASGQTADLVQFQESSGGAPSQINATGQFRIRSFAQSFGFTALGVAAGAATEIPVIVRGAASQTANLQEWQNSAGTVLAKIDSSGIIQSANAFQGTGFLNSSGQTTISIATNRNVGLATGSGSYGGGQATVFIGNATVVPTSNPTGGGILYVESGALKYRGSSGTVTTIANA